MIFAKVSNTTSSPILEGAEGFASLVDLGVGQYELIFAERQTRPYVPNINLCRNFYIPQECFNPTHFVEFDSTGITIEFFDPKTKNHVDQDFTLAVTYG